MSKYAELTETELQELLRSDSLEPYEKYDIVLELEKGEPLNLLERSGFIDFYTWC